jgi:transposase
MADDEEQRANWGDADWLIAQQRAEVLRRLVTACDAGRRSELIAVAAVELAVSRATVYRLLARFRTTEVTSALLPSRRGRPPGSKNKPPTVQKAMGVV